MNERSFIDKGQMVDVRTLTKGEHTREVILDAAERLILDQGYHGTSMRQIAQEAGIAVGGIYNHFGGKEAIFAALLERHQPYTDAVAGLSRLSGEDTAELIEGAARLLVGEGLADAVFIRLVFIDLQEFGGDTVFQLATQLVRGLLAFITPLVASGELRDDVPVPVLVRSFAGLFIFFVLSDIVAFGDGSPRIDVPLQFADELDWIGGMVELYLNGVLARRDARDSASPEVGPDARIPNHRLHESRAARFLSGVRRWLMSLRHYR